MNLKIIIVFILLISVISILWYLLLQTKMKIALYSFLALYVLVGILLLTYGVEYLGLIILTIYLGAVIILLLFIVMLIDDKSYEEKNVKFSKKQNNLLILLNLIILIFIVYYLYINIKQNNYYLDQLNYFRKMALIHLNYNHRMNYIKWTYISDYILSNEAIRNSISGQEEFIKSYSYIIYDQWYYDNVVSKYILDYMRTLIGKFHTYTDYEKLFLSHNNNIKTIGYYIYKDNYLSVWLAGMLLLLALIGSIVLAKSNKK